MNSLALALALWAPAPAHATPGVLSADEAADLTWMREEEKVARDVYAAMYWAYDDTIFYNIAWSEHAHFETMGDQLDVFGLPDPVVRFRVGAFTDPNLRALAWDLRAQGLVSLEEALRVGAFIEEIDILDLDDAIARTDEPSLQAAYASLRCGSTNHLRAFTRRYERATGTPYVAQALSQAEVDAIRSAPGGSCSTP